MASFRRLPSGKWQGIVKVAGKRYTRTDPLKKVVQDWAAELESQLRRGDFIDPNAGKVTLSAWWSEWQTTRRVAKATAAKNETHWRVHVEPAFGSWALASIQSIDVEKWVAGMVTRKVGGEAAATALRLLRQVLEAAVAARKIRTNPAEGVRAPKPPKHVDRFLDIDEADRLIAAITRPVRPPAGTPRGRAWEREPDPESQLLVRLLLDAGLRWQEGAGMHHFRVDVRRRRVRVQEVLERDGTIKPQPKSEAGSRWAPLTDELVELYLAHVARHGREGLVFAQDYDVAPEDRRPLDYSNWTKRIWAPAVRAAELAAPLPTPHDCRHSYGSWLADNGVPPHEIMVLMGHSSLRAVERYIHASEARMDRARDALGARRAHGGESHMQKAPSSGSENGA
ncbi:tyrosine-type recombinase/integrase [Nocardioides sp. SYSU D00065]|uniref:tyrosine-type recombinase/integrase n=1 Tax=Nocardioides sp. SYSU D00065 TaxID=2817378 RepID=UPI001B32130F|nr:tyrosine-type recombinase/integrase [Nocardioides sp. SYSU D00065]